jgi:serine protease AprX
MRGTGTGVFCVGLLVLLGVEVAGAGGKIGERLATALSSQIAGDPIMVWIHFTDKGGAGLSRAIPQDVVSPRSLQRRLNVLPADRALDFDDLPVEPSYVDQLHTRGVQIRQRSKWFNAVSAEVTAAQIQEISSLPFVRELDLLYAMPRDPRIQVEQPPPSSSRGPGKVDSPTALDYGPSLPQVSLLKIPDVHATGNAAQDVIVGVFDNGFRLPAHESIDSLKIIATRDFVDHKTSVVPNDPSPSTGAHGIYTLSALSGYAPGQLIGPAYGASYILARTENDSSETPVEEDNWVAAIEWADSIGVQVTSTSLVYLNYDLPYRSWTWQDMNGHTTKISLAATMAARKGIVVLNSAGNDGVAADPNINTLEAPADADSILAVGAVTPAGIRASFSSVGPTTSNPPRIKPDIMATGTSIYCASPTVTTGYLYVQGTSLSCPLAAGVAAMMLHAVPNATPMQVIEALKTTASQASHPDNRMGWGVINALQAIEELKSLVDPVKYPRAFALEQNFPNPFNPATTIVYSLPNAGPVTLRVYNVLGQEVRTLVDETQARGEHTSLWDGTNKSGSRVATGVYLYRLEFSSDGGGTTVLSKKMVLVK